MPSIRCSQLLLGCLSVQDVSNDDREFPQAPGKDFIPRIATDVPRCRNNMPILLYSVFMDRFVMYCSRLPGRLETGIGRYGKCLQQLHPDYCRRRELKFARRLLLQSSEPCRSRYKASCLCQKYSVRRQSELDLDSSN